MDEQTTPEQGHPDRLAETGFRCTFDRIGANRNVPPLDIPGITEADDDVLLDAVFRYADPRLGSSDVEVMVNAEEMRGLIVVGGWRPGGRFTITPLPAPTSVLPASPDRGGAR